jgi:glycosyltransferase involved in cell wall biosynthesis
MHPKRAAKPRLAIVVSHPIQYQAPLYRSLARSNRINIEVLFLSDHGLEPTFDHGFGKEIAFDVDLVGDFPHQFLPNRSFRPTLSRQLGLMNPALVRLLRPKLFDIALIHGWGHASNWLAYAACRAWRLPYLVRSEAKSDDHQHSRSLTRAGIIKSRARSIALRSVLTHAAGCLPIGKLNRDFYTEIGVSDDRLWFSPYSVDNERFHVAGAIDLSERAQMLRAIGCAPELPTVLLVAKLQPWKRPLDLLRAVSEMRQSVNVVIIGDGPLHEDVVRVSAQQQHSRALGFKNQTEIARWYGAADIFTLCSDFEPWGLAVNEAMAAGCVPVISDAVGCGPDLVDDATGLVYPVGEPSALAGALDRLVGSPALLEELRLRCADRIDEYSIQATTRGIERAAVAATGVAIEAA